MNFRSAQAARLDAVPDPEVLAFAADEGRILISHDFETMPKHFRQFTQRRRSPGVLLVRQDLPVGELVNRDSAADLESFRRHQRRGKSNFPCWRERTRREPACMASCGFATGLKESIRLERRCDRGGVASSFAEWEPGRFHQQGRGLRPIRSRFAIRRAGRECMDSVERRLRQRRVSIISALTGKSGPRCSGQPRITKMSITPGTYVTDLVLRLIIARQPAVA